MQTLNEILAYDSTERAMEIAATRFTSVRDRSIQKKGARIFHEGKIFSSSVVGECADDELLSQARANESGAVPFDYELAQMTTRSESSELSPEVWDTFASSVDSFLADLRVRFPDFIFGGNASLWGRRVRQEWLDTATVNQTIQGCTLGMYYKHKNSAGILDGGIGYSSIKNADFSKSIETQLKFLEHFETKASLTAGKMPVVFWNSSSLLPKLLESVRADYYCKDLGLFKKQLGEKLLSEKFSLYDVSYDLSRDAHKLIDADGYTRKDPALSLFENGIFKNIICDARNGQKYSKEATGNSTRSFDSAASLQFNHVRVGSGSRSSWDILNELDECLVVDLAMGGDFTDTGHFSTPVQNAYVMKKGQITGRAPDLTVSSIVSEMLGDDLIEVSSDSLDLDPNSPSIFTQINVIL